MKLYPETVNHQHQLANYCRTGQEVNIEGAVNRRLHHYRRLVSNVVNDSLSRAYPIAKSILDEENWNSLVNDFFINHDSQSPQIWKLPYEFYEYVLEANWAEKLSMPYLYDLLYFEWIEIEIFTMEDIDVQYNTSSENIFHNNIVVNPESQLIKLEYPVHLLSLNEAYQNKGNYFVFVYRMPDSGKVKFLNLSLLNAYIFELLILHGNMQLFLDELANKFKLPDNGQLIQHLNKFIPDMISQKAILGFRPGQMTK